MYKKKPWSGRFKEKTNHVAESFTSSIPFDVRLWEYDIQGSIAHTEMLEKQNLISTQEKNMIIKGLRNIETRIHNGEFEFSDELEDIHMNLEAALIDEIGPTGGKMHTARSRNDQVNLDLRLFLRDEINKIIHLIQELKDILAEMAKKKIDLFMPGYTHLQRAQPILLSHHLLAYWEMLDRDKERFNDCFKRVNILPLGTCAISGTTLPIDRYYVAKKLNFPEITHNSVDTVSDRDFALEFLSASSIHMSHLSRLSEDIILWSTWEFGFVELPDAFSTGSSIMPQKKNPDILELIRGKSGRIYGNMVSMLTVLKGIPLGYNRDLQEDKEPVFDTVDTIKSCLMILKHMLPKLKFRSESMKKAAFGGFSTATDLAEYLVKKGLPFREAHEITGKIVSYCLENRKELLDLSLHEFRHFSEAITDDVFSILQLEASINNKISYGGTAKELVLERLKTIKKAF